MYANENNGTEWVGGVEPCLISPGVNFWYFPKPCRGSGSSTPALCFDKDTPPRLKVRAQD